MIEYVLILAFVCVGAAGIVATVGTDVNGVFTATSNYVKNAATAAS